MSVNAIVMDDPNPLGNSAGEDGKRQLHVRAFPFGSVLPTAEYDAVTCAQVDPNTVRYEFRTGGASGTIVQSVTIDYGTATTIPFVTAVYT